jgi:hypothetical protein
MEKKLKVKLSNFKTTLTFNEWAKMYRVSSMYEERTPYYTGNLTELEPNVKSNLYQSVDDLLPRDGFFKTIFQTFKTKIKINGKRKQVN